MFKNKERHFDLHTRFSCDISSNVLWNNIVKTIQIRKVLRDSILRPDVRGKSHERNIRGVGNDAYNYIM